MVGAHLVGGWYKHPPWCDLTAKESPGIIKCHPFWGESNLMQMYGNFRGFLPKTTALFELVIILSLKPPWVREKVPEFLLFKKHVDQKRCPLSAVVFFSPWAFFFGPKVLQRFVFFRFVNSTLLSWVVWLIFLGEFWIVGNTMLLGPCWGEGGVWFGKLDGFWGDDWLMKP